MGTLYGVWVSSCPPYDQYVYMTNRVPYIKTLVRFQEVHFYLVCLLEFVLMYVVKIWGHLSELR